MAKMIQDGLVISLSKLYRNSENPERILTEDQIGQLEAVIKELINDESVMVEVDEVRE